jgi:hypothetical protein
VQTYLEESRNELNRRAEADKKKLEQEQIACNDDGESEEYSKDQDQESNGD